jgi:hypothetical protein
MQKTKLGGRRPTVAVIARRRRLHESEAGAVAGSGHVLSSAAMRLAERAHVPEQGRRATHSQPSPPVNKKITVSLANKSYKRRIFQNLEEKKVLAFSGVNKTRSCLGFYPAAFYLNI